MYNIIHTLPLKIFYVKQTWNKVITANSLQRNSVICPFQSAHQMAVIYNGRLFIKRVLFLGTLWNDDALFPLVIYLCNLLPMRHCCWLLNLDVGMSLRYKSKQWSIGGLLKWSPAVITVITVGRELVYIEVNSHTRLCNIWWL